MAFDVSVDMTRAMTRTIALASYQIIILLGAHVEPLLLSKHNILTAMTRAADEKTTSSMQQLRMACAAAVESFTTIYMRFSVIG